MRLLSLIAIGTFAVVFAGSAHAQRNQQPPSHRLLVKRVDLEVQLTKMREAAKSPKRGGFSEDSIKAETTYVQQRLAEGDFRVGDRVLMSVEDPGPVVGVATLGAGMLPTKTAEQQLTDTFTVGNNQELTLPGIGIVSMRGVLRSEAEEHLTTAVSQYIRQPVVHVRPLVTIAVSGGVMHPGYYAVPTNSVLSAVVTAAGGANKDGSLHDAAIKRGGKLIFDKKEVRQAVGAGKTIDEMELHPDDEIVVPENNGGAYEAIRFTAVLLSIPISLYTLGQIFSHH